jgi:hypothetical protein
MSRNLGALTLLDPSGPAWPVMGVLYLITTLTNMQNSVTLIYDDPPIHWLYRKRFISVLKLADMVSVKNSVMSSVE